MGATIASSRRRSGRAATCGASRTRAWPVSTRCWTARLRRSWRARGAMTTGCGTRAPAVFSATCASSSRPFRSSAPPRPPAGSARAARLRRGASSASETREAARACSTLAPPAPPRRPAWRLPPPPPFSTTSTASSRKGPTARGATRAPASATGFGRRWRSHCRPPRALSSPPSSSFAAPPPPASLARSGRAAASRPCAPQAPARAAAAEGCRRRSSARRLSLAEAEEATPAPRAVTLSHRDGRAPPRRRPSGAHPRSQPGRCAARHPVGRSAALWWWRT
mmetsp:Transcript_25852/g.74816  ORF Transcript_25852/g.74816 Transcript_25852/m.74816 type:complete len:280 (+) Transcript_25852:904-1743(+)